MSLCFPAEDQHHHKTPKTSKEHENIPTSGVPPTPPVPVPDVEPDDDRVNAPVEQPKHPKDPKNKHHHNEGHKPRSKELRFANLFVFCDKLANLVFAGFVFRASTSS